MPTLQFPKIPDELPTHVKNRLNELRSKYQWYMTSIRFSEPLIRDELLRKARGFVEQAERIILNAQALSSHTADPNASGRDD